MRARHVFVSTAVAVLMASGLVSSDADATPASVPPPSAVALAPLATLDGPATAKADGIALRNHQEATVRSVTLTYGPHSFSGWHEHPGIVLAVVQSGAVRRSLPCGPAETFTVGQAFTEVGPHYVENITDTPAVLVVTQIVPADTPANGFRIDLPEPAPKCHRDDR